MLLLKLDIFSTCKRENHWEKCYDPKSGLPFGKPLGVYGQYSMSKLRHRRKAKKVLKQRKICRFQYKPLTKRHFHVKKCCFHIKSTTPCICMAQVRNIYLCGQKLQAGDIGHNNLIQTLSTKQSELVLKKCKILIPICHSAPKSKKFCHSKFCKVCNGACLEMYVFFSLNKVSQG